MNRIIVIALLLLTSCSKQNNDVLIGVWKVEGPYYSATYEIIPQGDGFVGKVMHYDDGTSRYSSKDKRICFDGLMKQDSIYVDGVSSASVSNKKARTICIKVKSPDSLEAVTYVSQQPLREWWIRQK